MQWLTTLDFTVLHKIQQIFSYRILDIIMPKITVLGNKGIIWVVTALIMLCFSRTRKTGLATGTACIGCLITGNLLLKNIVARARPCWIEEHLMLIAIPDDYSFPSGHTMASFAAATVLWKMNRKVGTAAYILAVLIAFSRLYLYVHFPSDVLAGAIIGFIIGTFSVKLTDVVSKKINQKRKSA